MFRSRCFRSILLHRLFCRATLWLPIHWEPTKISKLQEKKVDNILPVTCDNSANANVKYPSRGSKKAKCPCDGCREPYSNYLSHSCILHPCNIHWETARRIDVGSVALELEFEDWGSLHHVDDSSTGMGHKTLSALTTRADSQGIPWNQLGTVQDWGP